MRRRICKATGCQRYALDGMSYCYEHQHLQRRDDEARKMHIKNHGIHDDLYNTYRWRKMSKEFLKAHPVCEVCGEPATDVDHITPHNGDSSLFFDQGNLQSLCRSCHNYKTNLESREKIRRKKDGKLWY